MKDDHNLTLESLDKKLEAIGQSIVRLVEAQQRLRQDFLTEREMAYDFSWQVDDEHT